MSTINWKKPIEFLPLGTSGDWVPAKLVVDDVKKADGHRTHCIRYTDSKGFDGFFVIGSDGREYESTGATVRVRNVPEKKSYTTISYRNKDGSVSASVQSGVGLSNAEIGKEFYGKPILNVVEFTVG